MLHNYVCDLLLQRMISQEALEDFHYNIAPKVSVFGFTFMTQILSVYGSTSDDVTWSLFGNTFSWTLVGLMFLWAFASLKAPGKEYKGPPSPSGYIPTYKANGLQYFLVSFLVLVIVLFFRPQTAVVITQNFPQIIATCNISALLLCYYLYQKGKEATEQKDQEAKPMMFEFYRGMELHPQIMGVDVKQLSNCRFGLMAWFFLINVFFVSGWMTQGFYLAPFIGVVLQTVYLAKFYWWETGYFHTLDITLDRAGYYICWGCIVWVPCFYTFSSYYLSSRPAIMGTNGSWLILFFGLLCTALNYWVDWEKEYFRRNGGRCRLWGKVASFIPAQYKNTNGKIMKSQLLTTGFWGTARHLNYLFEILIAVSWSLPTLGYGIWPFMYPIFLTVLLVHRIYRDEKKCQEKYGNAWTQYCEKVPFRLIPGVF